MDNAKGVGCSTFKGGLRWKMSCVLELEIPNVVPALVALSSAIVGGTRKVRG